MHLGYDFCSVSDKYILHLFQYAQLHSMQLLHLKKHHQRYYFYIPSYQRIVLRKFEYLYEYHGTIGLMKYIYYLFHDLLRCIGITGFLLTLWLCTQFVFKIDIKGDLKEVNISMLHTLKTADIAKYRPKMSYESLNDVLGILKKTYKQDLEYVNVYQNGGVFHVEYTKRNQDHIEKENYQNLIANQDGMIYMLDVDSGVTQVKKNDYVKKGDLLIENTIISTQNQTHIIPVKGKVYAYTFHQYSASISPIEDQGEAFYHLLLKIRSQIPTGAQIDKENVLQMEHSRSKITLKMHYTLIEDIAVKGEHNEANN